MYSSVQFAIATSMSRVVVVRSERFESSIERWVVVVVRFPYILGLVPGLSWHEQCSYELGRCRLPTSTNRQLSQQT